ncbi:MAG TPA: YggT family protein [Halieaceae bacterium]|jgi:YggT family protein|uniref:YggT family protein n=1 Tax=Haliea TaxID=475794 RepID=UPI0003F9DB62|nr:MULTISPECIES: YggT family protein [Haliea]HBQ39743.1 YggT family protein [Halieaceae bacterium]MAD64119.1 YggT family protein [Haliea sp.]MAY92525.1 YggT family protein [Haliea sp.]MBK40847.1 YggT family protein [Haliea sp.]MBP68578.1 YggT family protein [Haliea sp.]|tara:strand:+ start:17543 stop:18130 length:588 start_codon:yes stop_codon:yes gene_type:complete
MNALSDIVAYLLQTVLNLALLAILLRFLLQLVRADFYNPVSQFLAKVTNPLVLPVRRVIPAYRGLDLSTLLLALLLQMAAIVALLALNGLGPPGVLTLLVWSVLGIVGLLVNIYFFALLAMIILSWIAPGGRHPALLLLFQLTEPVMAPFRRMLPSMGGIDFSPILVFILINVIQIALGHMAAAAGLPAALVIGL